jgi:type II secretory pathway component PulF
VIATSHTLRDHGLVLAAMLALLVVGSAAAARTTAGRAVIDRLVLRMPVAGPLVRAIETGRLLRSLGALVTGGVAVSRAMPLAVRTIANTAMRASLMGAHERILSGTALGDAVAASGALPADAIGLMRVGERTGRLDAALERAATLFEGRATRRLKALTTMLTPVLTIGFGMLAGIIVYAMLSTILSINDLAAQ